MLYSVVGHPSFFLRTGPKTKYCDSQPCVDGKCKDYNDGSGYLCECESGYTGVHCEQGGGSVIQSCICNKHDHVIITLL